MNEDPKESNSSRAERVERLVRNYCRTPGYDGEPDYEADIVDLLADLRHFCAGAGLDFDELDERAKRHYVAEKKDLNRCNNCGKLWTTDQLERIDDFWDRVNAGEIMPSGQCPDCGCLCHRQFSGGVMRILVKERREAKERNGEAECPCCKGSLECFPDQDGSCDYACTKCGWHQHIPGDDEIAREAEEDHLRGEGCRGA